jgi:2-oxoglutarate ferredoxin oxidoreductase subunit delta
VEAAREHRSNITREDRITATGRIEIDFERCKACELCVPACPKDCIGMGTAINRQGYGSAVFERPDDCTGCAFCAETCPDACILVWR